MGASASQLPTSASNVSDKNSLGALLMQQQQLQQLQTMLLVSAMGGGGGCTEQFTLNSLLSLLGTGGFSSDLQMQQPSSSSTGQYSSKNDVLNLSKKASSSNSIICLFWDLS